MTIGFTEADAAGSLSSLGINFSAWTDSAGLTVDNGSVFLMHPDEAPEGDVVVAQLTVQSGSSGTVTMGMQGHGTTGEDWDVHRVVFTYP